MCVFVCVFVCVCAREHALPVSGIAQAETASQDAQDEAHLLHWDQPVLSTHQIPLDSTDTRGRKRDLSVITCSGGCTCRRTGQTDSVTHRRHREAGGYKAQRPD